MTIRVRITVTVGSWPGLPVAAKGKGQGATPAEALAVAILDVLPVVGVTLLDVIRAARRATAGTARVFLPGPRIGQTIAGDRPSR